jgi:predicted ATPase
MKDTSEPKISYEPMNKALIDIEIPGIAVKKLGGINVIIGKNGSGKSSFLKEFDRASNNFGSGAAVRYITPERGGVLEYDPNIERNVSSSPNWLKDVRRNNQFGQFKQQSMLLYRRLELIVLREIEKDRETKTDFESVIGQINGLLEHVKLERRASDFAILPKTGNTEIPVAKISSGESEIIGLAIECITFARECKNAPIGWLLLDEPDVHLHPDLQVRFATLLVELTKDSPMRIILATHSTAFLAALSDDTDSRVSFLSSKASVLSFRSISESTKAILPVFGAHPLSAIFNKQKLLILEGSDDARIWQKANRCSKGQINVYPVEAGGDGQLITYETEASEILQSIYESASAFSIRDRDDGPAEDLQPLGPVERFRLRCRTAENLLLADETLASLGSNWTELKMRITLWLSVNLHHSHFEDMKSFEAGGYQRKDFPIKSVRNDLLAIIGTSLSWEDAVGISISKISIQTSAPPDSLQAYLGSGICSALL